MGQQIIKQPDGLYAVWSSVSDLLIAVDATRDEIIAMRLHEITEDVKASVHRVCDQLDLGKKPYFQFTMSWKDVENDYKMNFAKPPRKDVAQT